MLAIDEKYGPTLTASGMSMVSRTAATRSRYRCSTSALVSSTFGGDEVDVQLQGVAPACSISGRTRPTRRR